MSNNGFQAAIFDVDGVLVDTPHQRAWKDSLRELMASEWADIRDQSTWSDQRFTPEVYEQAISGKPRMSGALAALEYFNVPDADKRVGEYAEHKQTRLVELIQEGQFKAFPDALRLAMAVHAAGIPMAAASSSKNADEFLRAIRLDTFAAEERLDEDFIKPELTLLDIFDADMSGRDFVRGKPDPEIFLAAAAELGAAPQGCLVIEDAASGIHAAKAAGMAALGVARADDQALLEAANADLVVTSLDQVDVTRLTHGELARRPS